MKSKRILKVFLVAGLILSSNCLFAATKMYQGLGKAVTLE